MSPQLSRYRGWVIATLGVVAHTLGCKDATPTDASLDQEPALRIVTSTTGQDPDADGYSALIVDLTTFSYRDTLDLPVNGSVSVNVPRGRRYFVTLREIAPNCAVDTRQSPELVADFTVATTAEVSFKVLCEGRYTARLPAGTQLAFVRDGRIWLVNSDGSDVTRLTDGPSDEDPAWSPDGRRLAFVRRTSNATDIYLVDADGSNLLRRTNGGSGWDPAWSPDGQRIAFSSLTSGSSNIHVMSAVDDGMAASLVVARPGWDAQPAWSPDGSRIAYASDWAAYDFTSDIFVTTPAGDSISQLTYGFGFWPNLVQYYQPAWSPNGARLAVVRCAQAFYTCDVGTIAVMTNAGTGLTELARTRGFARPTWSPDGSTIAFSHAGIIAWIRVATGEKGLIVEQGASPAWRPQQSALRN